MYHTRSAERCARCHRPPQTWIKLQLQRVQLFAVQSSWLLSYLLLRDGKPRNKKETHFNKTHFIITYKTLSISQTAIEENAVNESAKKPVTNRRIARQLLWSEWKPWTTGLHCYVVRLQSSQGNKQKRFIPAHWSLSASQEHAIVDENDKRK